MAEQNEESSDNEDLFVSKRETKSIKESADKMFASVNLDSDQSLLKSRSDCLNSQHGT